MAQYTGCKGLLKIGNNTVADINSMDFSIDVDLLDTTAYGDGCWKKQIPGLKSWTGKASGKWNMLDTTGQKALQDAILGGLQVTTSFMITDTIGYTGDCYVKSIAPKSAVDATVDVDFSLEGTGPLNLLGQG